MQSMETSWSAFNNDEKCKVLGSVWSKLSRAKILWMAKKQEAERRMNKNEQESKTKRQAINNNWRNGFVYRRPK